MKAMQQRIEEVKHLTLCACAPAKQQDLVFREPSVRKRSVRLTVENADSVRLNDLCDRLSPAQVFLRTTSDLATSSRLDIYIPKRRFVLLRALYYALFTASAVSFGLLMYVLIHTQ